MTTWKDDAMTGALLAIMVVWLSFVGWCIVQALDVLRQWALGGCG